MYCFPWVLFCFPSRSPVWPFVDYSRLLSVYYQDSRKIKEVNDFENEIIEELASIADEIAELEEKKIDAQRAGDENEALSYDEMIEQKKKYQQDYLRIKENPAEQYEGKICLQPLHDHGNL